MNSEVGLAHYLAFCSDKLICFPASVGILIWWWFFVKLNHIYAKWIPIKDADILISVSLFKIFDFSWFLSVEKNILFYHPQDVWMTHCQQTSSQISQNALFKDSWVAFIFCWEQKMQVSSAYSLTSYRDPCGNSL